MDFINKGFSSVFKIAIGLIIFIVLIRILPWIALVAAGIWGISKVVKSFKSWKSGDNIRREEVKTHSNISNEKDEFDFSEKKIVDVDYKEV
ncbi:hypothetical protein HBE96_08475 [Clostridium sp. P21]|uniref:Uncharacterized protein n=1 Tax=Clostridium muellerianum TaxID=2716538 RepID=A0A7Y0HN17_9CLOT|nr:hypothetical protein [Clostridium muellerianum]NMM62730.1 hypothetical protein [Clostridium muellerianum]